jgi:membrane protein DedA with SNARE-associated domain
MDILEKYILLYFSGWLIGPIVLAGAGMYAQSFLERVFSYVAVITGNMTAVCVLFFGSRFLREKYFSRIASFFRISESSLKLKSEAIEGRGLFLVLLMSYFFSPLVEFSIFLALGISKVRTSVFLKS